MGLGIVLLPIAVYGPFAIIAAPDHHGMPIDWRLTLGWSVLLAACVALLLVYPASWLEIMYLSSVRSALQARGDHRAPFLVLRSFTRGPLTTAPTEQNVLPGEMFNPQAQIAIGGGELLIVHLVDAVDDLGMIVTLGHGGDFFGGFFGALPDPILNYHGFAHSIDELNLLVPESEWRAAFLAIARSSRAIFLIPEITPGVTLEIETLAETDLMSRVIVLMPFDLKANGERAARWEVVRSSLRERGFRLPPYDFHGLAYPAKGDLSAGKRKQLSDHKPKSDANWKMFQAAVRDCIPTADVGEPLGDVLRRMETLHGARPWTPWRFWPITWFLRIPHAARRGKRRGETP